MSRINEIIKETREEVLEGNPELPVDWALNSMISLLAIRVVNCEKREREQQAIIESLTAEIEQIR